MKKKISKILGVVLSLALLSSLAIISVPVAAQPGQNVFDNIGGPPIVTPSGVGVMAVAPDGTIYASILNAYGFGFWSVWKSVDEGTNWTPTEFTGFTTEITDIAVSPNYGADGIFYISLLNARIYRMGDEGDAIPVLLKACVDSDGTTANAVYDLDLWYDGSNIWIMAGTNVDVLVLRDALFESWRDQELRPPPTNCRAYEVAYATDFNSSNLIWAVVDYLNSGFFGVTCTVSPGQWGNTIKDAMLVNQAPPIPDFVVASRFVDLEFSDYYTSADPIMYIGCTDPTPGYGNIFLVQGAYVDVIAPTEVTPLLPTEDDILSVEVSGNVILAGTYRAGVGPPVRMYRSDNLGDTFAAAVKPPTGWGNFYVYMAPGAFDPDDGVAYCSSQLFSVDESSFNITNDGGQTWNQNSWVDTFVIALYDMAFAPEAASQPAFQISYGSSDSLWRSDDVTAADPEWVRVQCSQVSGPSLWYERVDYSMDGTTVMLYGLDPPNYELWKSTDNGQTFNHWRNLPADIGYINDLVVYDGSTIYAACGGGLYGFYGTSRFGPATKELINVNSISLALQPGFNPDDPDNCTIALGDNDAWVYISDDAGENWGLAQDVIGLGSGNIYVAFDSEFAVDGADGEDLLYFASSGTIVGQAKVAGTSFSAGSVKALTDDTFGGVAEANSGFTGIGVSRDNALYAIGWTGAVAPVTTYGPPVAWGSVTMDPFADLVATPPILEDAITAIGQIDISGNDPGPETFNDLPINDYAFIVTGGSFSDWDSLSVDATYGTTLQAVSDTVVAGTIFLEGSTAADTGYINVVFTGLANLEAGETVTLDNIDWLNYDSDGEYVTVAIMGQPIVNTTGVWTDNNGNVLNVVGTTLEAISPSFVSGQIALTNAAAETGDLMGLTLVGDFGFEWEILEEEGIIDTLADWDLVCVVEASATPPIDPEASMWRLLLHEDDSVWETADIDGAFGLWLTEGSNFVWTIVNAAVLHGLEDTLSGPVTDVAATSITETSAKISWSAMTGAALYEVEYNPTVTTMSTSKTLTGLTNNKTYTVKVRAAPQPGSPFHSRWSSGVKFTTIESIAMPDNQVPINGMQEAPLLPSFVWGTVGNAVSYEFELGIDPAFGSTIVEATIAAPTTAYTCTTELEYDTNYYWRLRAVSATGTYSTWCVSNFHTRMEAIPPVTVEPPPTPTIILPTPVVVPPDINVTVVPPDVIVEPPPITVIPPDINVTVIPPEIVVEVPAPVTVEVIEEVTEVIQEEITPIFIWIIVAIGAVLTIAVIVLIIRTRRVV